MAKIQINEFKGIMPKLAADKLPPNMAQTARDVKTSSGELKAFRRPTSGYQLPGTEYKTLFEYLSNGVYNLVYYNNIVHWARSPVADDVFERMYFTGVDGEYRAFANDLFGTFDFTTDFYEPGSPAGKAPTLTPQTPGGVFTAYYYTLVSRYGEEGPPSAVASVANQTVNGNMHVDDITYPSTYEHLITPTESPGFLNRPTINVYRTADDGAGNAAFLLALTAEWFDTAHDYVVGDYVFYGGGGTYDLYKCTTIHPGGTGWDAGHFTQGDAVPDADLGQQIDSIYNDHAPADLTNLRPHPNGFSVASKNNVLYFTDPFKPWAWPEDYPIPIDAQIVALGVYGSTIVVTTDANIYTFSGPHPLSLYKSKLSYNPNLSQRALVETDDGVLFPSLEGFQLVSGAGVRNVTQEMFSPEDWVDYELETMHGTWYNKAYYGFYESLDYNGYIIIDFLNGSITSGAEYHQAGHVTLSDGLFRTVFNSDIAQPTVWFVATWDADPSMYNLYSYKSPRYILEKPQNFKVAQVILDTDFYNDVLDSIADNDTLVDLNSTSWTETDWGVNDLLGSMNGSQLNEMDVNGDNLYSLQDIGVQSYINFKIWVDGVLKFTKQVSDSTMFKLPRGFKDKKWELGVDGMIPITRITMATSTEEIV